MSYKCPLYLRFLIYCYFSLHLFWNCWPIIIVTNSYCLEPLSLKDYSFGCIVWFTYCLCLGFFLQSWVFAAKVVFILKAIRSFPFERTSWLDFIFSPIGLRYFDYQGCLCSNVSEFYFQCYHSLRQPRPPQSLMRLRLPFVLDHGANAECCSLFIFMVQQLLLLWRIISRVWGWLASYSGDLRASAYLYSHQWLCSL